MPPAASRPDPVADDGLPRGWDAADLPQSDSELVDDERIGSRDLAEWRSRPGRVLANATTKAADALAGLPPSRVSLLVLTLTAAIGAFLMVVLAAGAGEVYEDVAHADGVAGFDRPVLDAAVAMRTPDLDTWVTRFTDLGGPVLMPFIALTMTAYAVWRWRSRTPIVLVVLTVAGALATTILGKDVVGRARPPRELAVPPYEVSASFPSGHTLNATAILGITAYLLLVTFTRTWTRVAALGSALVFVLAMGLSRVFLGHHWLTDVVAGWLLGLFWVIVVVTGHRLKVTLDRRNRREDQAD